MRMELFMFVGFTHTMFSPSKQNVFVYVNHSKNESHNILVYNYTLFFIYAFNNFFL